METLAHADFFFFVTTIAVVVVTVAFAGIAFYAIGIMRDIRDIVRRARKRAKELESDFEDLRQGARHDTARLHGIADMLLSALERTISRLTSRPHD